MQFSVIIVNHNVCAFLEQCLLTVLKAAEQYAVEIIVVDNASEDESRNYLPEKFPQVRFIWNSENLGYGKANNQGMATASGEILLLLNPDTLVPVGLFQRFLSCFSEYPGAGAAGMRMVDGAGNFLPESKRGMPYPSAVFFRMSGLSKLFPRHRSFSQYYLGQLDQLREHQVDILAGACMAISRKAYEKTGGFDDQFFLYGEDIDLSWRIKLAGFSNYYLPQPGIVHFKGESAGQDPESHRHFYEAMLLFSRKHFKGWTVGRHFVLQAMAAVGQRFRQQRRKGGIIRSEAKRRTWKLTGDPAAVASLEASLPDGISLATDQQKPDRLVIAIGDGDALKNFLQEPVTDAIPRCFFVQGAGYVVGSSNKEATGEQFRLKQILLSIT